MNVSITELRAAEPAAVRRAAELLVDGSRDLWPEAWPDLAAAEAGRRGGSTPWLGTDDGSGTTSLSGVDLYPHTVAHPGGVTVRRPHPLDFHRRPGFAPAGVVPDASGRGRPDLLLARGLARG